MAEAQVESAPEILRQPTNLVAGLYQTVVLTAQVAGTPVPTIEWQFNGMPLPTGGWAAKYTNGEAVLTLYNVRTNNAGAYRLVASNEVGTATSDVAVVTVQLAPLIARLPASHTVVEGRQVCFDPLIYGMSPIQMQWFFCGEPMAANTYSSICITGFGTNRGEYRIVVTNAFGSATGTVMLSVTNAPSHPGAMDVSFPITTDLPPASALAVQPDGRMVVSCGNWNSTVRRFLADGSADPSFEMAVVDGRVRSIALAANGRLMIGGEFSLVSGVSNQSLARLHVDGTVDQTFKPSWPFSPQSRVYRIGIQSNGRIVASGERLPWDNSALLVVFEQDGTAAFDALPPSSLGGALCGTCGLIDALGVRSDDSFIANFNGIRTFSAFGNASVPTNIGSLKSAYPMADGRMLITVANGRITRLLLNGHVDQTFASEATTNYYYYGPLAVQKDGKIVAACSLVVEGQYRNSVVRLFPNGLPDPSFDTRSGFDGTINALHIAKDGGILVAGRFQVDGSPYVSLVRLHNDATLLPSITDAPTNQIVVAGSDTALTVATPCAGCSIQWQKDGTNVPSATLGSLFIRRVTGKDAGVYQVIVQNETLSVTSAPITLSVLVNDQPGIPDLDFNTGAGPDARIRLVTRLPDGRILAGGDFRKFDGVQRIGLARLHPNGSVDASFDAHLNQPGIFALTTTPAGIIYVAGAFTNVNGVPRRGMARLHADGALDTSFEWTGMFYEGQIAAITELRDGRVLIGSASDWPSGYQIVLASLESSGALDEGFAYKNYWSSTLLKSVRVVNEQPDGSILIAGDGGIDLLRSDGSRISGFPTGPSNWSINAVAQTWDGRIYIAGYGNEPPYRVVAQWTNGQEAASFDASALNRYGDFGRALMLDACGRLLVAGLSHQVWTSISQTGPRNSLVRLHTDGSVDNSFPQMQLDGRSLAAINIEDNTVLVAGAFTRVNGVYMPGIARIKTPLPAPVLRGVAYTSRSVVSGRPVSFTAEYDECASPAVQWYQNGVPVPGATNVTLAFANPQPGMSGDYTVVARNASGSVTSSVINLTVSRASIAPGRRDTDFEVPSLSLVTNVTAMALRENGKVLLAGLVPESYLSSYNPQAHLVQLNQDGTLDASFTTWNYFNFRTEVGALALASSGDVIADTSNYYDNVTRRFGPNGFPLSGQPWPNGWSRGASILAFDALSRLIVVSRAGTEMARFKTNGFSDGEFSAVTDAEGIKAIAQEADGNWVVGGGFSTLNGKPHNRMARISQAGGVDATFNIGTGPNETVQAIGLQASGRIIIGGAFTTVQGEPRSRIAALRPDGSLDLGFSTNAAANSNINAMVVQPDGKVVIAGKFSVVNGVGRAGIARLLPDGELDLAFDPGLGVNGNPERLVLDQHGRIYVTGTFKSYGGWPCPGIVRLHGDIFLPGASGSSTVEVRALTASGWDYTLERSATITQGEWGSVMTVPGDGTVRSFTNSPADGASFYRLRVE